MALQVDSRSIKAVMTKHQIDVAKEVVYDDVRPYLKQEGLFSELDIQAVEVHKTNFHRMIHVCERVTTIDPTQFPIFLDIISKSNEEVVKKIQISIQTQLQSQPQKHSMGIPSSSNNTLRCTSLQASSSVCPATGRKNQMLTSSTGHTAEMHETKLHKLDLGTSNSPTICPHQSGLQNNQSTGSPSIEFDNNNNRSTPLGYKETTDNYRMESNPRGYVLIINNEKFDRLSLRRWSECDKKSIYHMFKYLGFKISLVDNCTAGQMKEQLELFAKFQPLKSASALAVVILTHGTHNDILFGTNGRTDCGIPVKETYLTKSDLIQTFKPDQCQNMSGKPKLFIIQACRGAEDDKLPSNNQFQNETDLRTDGVSTNTHLLDREPSHIHSSHSTSEPITQLRAAASDMCFVHSSTLGYKAYRKRDEGSPFVKVLTETIFARAQDTEFRNIIKQVQRQMNDQPLTNELSTLCDFSSQLLLDWYLNPPQAEFDQQTETKVKDPQIELE